MNQFKLIISAFFLISPFSANADPIVYEFGPHTSSNHIFSGEIVFDESDLGNTTANGWDIISWWISTPGVFGESFTLTSDSGSIDTFDSRFSGAIGSDYIFSQRNFALGFYGNVLGGDAPEELWLFDNQLCILSCSTVLGIHEGYDGEVSSLTVSIVGAHYSFRLKDSSSVPEPGTLALLGLGLVGMAARRKKKV